MRILLLVLLPFSSLVAQDLTADIKSLNRQLETYLREGELQSLAAMYLDEAVLLSPGNTVVTGRKQIDQYWTNIAEPVDWKLEVILVTRDENEIYKHPHYKSLATKPPAWRPHVEVDADDVLVYELGHSTLTTRWQGEIRSSQVDFLLVWKLTDEGYRVLADTYSW